MANSSTRRFPVAVTQLPMVRCAVCDTMVPYHKGAAGDALTAHYTQAHPELTSPD